ncbi:MAG: HAD-IIA family hydrolase [Anaerolineae bacterium]|jgi:4-nitrophenyl phosphatase|nr:MAG: HAD-IIA family hydrolase [Anaerolineae bacterium]MCL4879655.1 HAD-IIA family hydrolase [Anaerolineae bacterium]
MELDLKSLKTFLLDGDGVLYEENRPFPGINRFFDFLEHRGFRWALLTNNSTQSVNAFRERLARFNVKATNDQIFTSSSVLGAMLAERFGPGAPVYVIGEHGLKQTLRDSGLTVYQDNDVPGQVAAVAAAIDRQLTYQKLQIATRLIRAGAAFVTTNTDRTLPTPEGHIPGSGAVVASLIASTDVTPIVMGKPEPTMYEVALKQMGADPNTTVAIGDRLETDILGGIRAGIKTIFVLSGAGTQGELQSADYAPDLVIKDIATLTDELEKAW